MPMYRFTCALGHVAEQRASFETNAIDCVCGLQAKRAAVYPISSPRKWASEFVMPASAREAHEEALGYKRDALAAMQEAVGNAFGGS